MCACLIHIEIHSNKHRVHFLDVFLILTGPEGLGKKLQKRDPYMGEIKWCILASSKLKMVRVFLGI
jgi:hypothetical protein